jgi:probable HAF family extracellular repeat protein
MNIGLIRVSLGFVILLAVANPSTAQSPQYQLLDLGGAVGGYGFNFIGAGISAGGQAVAAVQLPEGRGTREWDAQNGWRDIAGPSPSFPYTDAAAINANGSVVGRAYNSDTIVPHAFVWIDGVTFDLNTLAIQGADSWVLEYANDITDSGMILGRGTIAGQPHNFVLIPTPSSTSTVGGAPRD